MSTKMQLKNVRLSFPAIWKKAEFEGKETKFEATFLLHKDDQADQIKALEKLIEDFAVEKFGAGKVPKALKRTCLIDGDEKDYDGYENHMAFKGGSNKRFTIIDRDRTPLTEEDGKPYSGCYCNAIIGLWYSDHPKGGKQILGKLAGIQFFKDGESFGADDSADVDEFDAFDDEDDLLG
jgi:hypothetical protein